MTVLFWILAGVMILAALAFIAFPLWRGARPSGDSSATHADVALYRQRRTELDREREAGLLSESEHREALSELDRQLLVDTEGAEQEGAPAPGQGRARWPLVVAAVSVPLIAVGLYLEVGGGSAALDGQSGQRFSQQDIEAMVRSLEERLQENPDNGQGWLMLGRSYSVMGRGEEAVRALVRARRLLGDRPEVLVEYAQALAMTRDQRSLNGKPARLLEKALEQAPDHPQALWLSGVAAAESGDYATAVARWERLLKQMPEDSRNARMVRDSLRTARSRMSGGQVASASGSPDAAGGSPDTNGQDASLRVKVSLAGELADRAAPGDTVFIFARAPAGPPMPLAAVRRKVSDLPLTVTLDDGDSMMSGRGISGHDRVAVTARVSRSGGATARPGDLEAKARTVSVGSAVSLTIDSVVGQSGRGGADQTP